MSADFFVHGRRTGKTTALLQWARAAPNGENRIIVVKNHVVREELKRANMDLSGQIVTRGEARLGQAHPLTHHNTVLGVDNVDTLLVGLYNKPIGYATATGTTLPLPF